MLKILHLSDTHGYHRSLINLPGADVVVHSGDFTMTGSEREAIDFLNWFCDLQYEHKIFISGNHDECLYEARIEGMDENVHYLCNTGVEIKGTLFFGVPMFTRDCISGRQSLNYSLIPGETSVLVTHSPAFGILDYDDGINYGSEDLLKRVKEIRPRAHLFGHIHRQHGIVNKQGTVFSNGAVMNVDNHRLRTANLIEIQLE